MEITLEQVERLREKADVSYAQAKEALEYSGGNLLDALIYLEEKGAIPRPEGAYYSTRGESTASSQESRADVLPELVREEKRTRPKIGIFRRIRYALLDNELEIWRRDQPVTALPVLILILLLVFAFWVTVPLLILGLFLGFRYRFSGPDLERDSINDVMGSVADGAAGLGRQVMDELRSQHDKYTKGKQDDQ